MTDPTKSARGTWWLVMVMGGMRASEGNWVAGSSDGVGPGLVRGTSWLVEVVGWD